MIGDMNEARLSHAKKVGFRADRSHQARSPGRTGGRGGREPTVDSVIDAVGFEARAMAAAISPPSC